MDQDTTAGELQVHEQATADEIGQHVEESLGAADGDVSPLTGLDPDDAAGPAQEKLGEVKAHLQDKVGDVAGAAQQKATEAKAAMSGAAEDLLGRAKAADPASAATQAWNL
ncbi:MAG TPA: hypothetical protein VFR49_03760, partial [Solirubrobacteraceae bacterium]|nr:hypothetical protein [Solirubrobacteraceae bacterium]